MAGRSDISVRMTPEGTQEVVNALNRVRNEASRTATAQNQAVAGINKITQSLQGLRSIIPAIGLAALVTGFTRLIKSSLDLADSIGDLATATGASTKSLSVIAYAAKEAGQSFDVVEIALRRFTKQLSDLRSGEKTATEIFGRIGLGAKDFAGLDTGQAFARVASQMASYQGSAEKAAVSQDLFGRSGMDLIEILDKLGTEGFDQLARKAQSAGAIIDQQTADMAGEIKRNVGVIESQLTQAALQFTQGFAPAAEQAMGMFSRSLSDGSSTMKSFGDFVGKTLQVIVIGFITSMYAIEVAFVRLKNRIAAIGQTAAGVVRSGAAGAGVIVGTGLDWLTGWTGTTYFKDKVAALQEYRRQQDQSIENNWKEAESEIAVAEARAKSAYLQKLGLQGVPTMQAPGGGAGGAGGGVIRPGGGGPSKRVADTRRAEMEFLRAQLEAENRLIDAQLTLREDREKEAYESGRMSLKEYYDSRRAILEERQRREAEMIRAELAAVEGATAKDKEKQLRNEAKAIQLRTELQVKELGFQKERIDLDREELTELRKLNEEKSRQVETAADTQFQLSQDNMKAQGKTREAATNELYMEIEALRAKLTVEGQITAEAQAQLDLKRQLGQAEIDYQAQREQVQAAFNNLSAQEAAIRTQVESGRMSEAQGEAQILTLRQQQLPVLQRMVELLMQMAQLTGNASYIAEAAAMTAQMGTLEASVARATLTFQTFKATAIDAAKNALTQFFTSGIQNAKSFGDAMRQMALSVIQSLTAMIAQMLIAMMFKKLFGGLGFSGGGFVGGGGGADHMVRMASGGVVSGPGTSTSDSVPAMLSAGEFVVNAGAVAQPGMLAHLVDINRGLYPTIPRVGIPRFADGGLATPPAGPAGFDSSLTVSLSPGLVASELDTPEGTRLIVKKLGENKRLVRQVLYGDR